MIPILNIQIAGEPITYKRVRTGKVMQRFDPTKKQKQNFQWEVKAAAPKLSPVSDPITLLINVWSSRKPVTKKSTGREVFQTDWDNYAKFYCDALTGLAWDDDAQIVDARVIVHRFAVEPRVELLVWIEREGET